MNTRLKVTRRWHLLDDTEVELPQIVPNVIFKTRVRDESIEGPNPYRWQDVTSFDLFANKRVILFSLPGAFTPTCSTYQVPDFEKMYDDFRWNGIDEIYCVSVNDAFVMNAWGKQLGVQKVKLIPDGSGKFTNSMDMDVNKHNVGFGSRSWRYAIIVNNGTIEKWFIEPNPRDDAEDDPYGETSPQNILKWLLEEKNKNENSPPF